MRSSSAVLQDFLRRHALPSSYLAEADQWFMPLLHHIVDNVSASAGDGATIVGINGCQGSGKSTLADYLRTMLVQAHGLSAVCLSLDDFYLTKSERTALAERVHPLLVTRGVPGTHDVELARQVIGQLQNSPVGTSIAIPRFNKLIDDRWPHQRWDHTTAPVDVIILEGWCLGTPAQAEADMPAPVNDLEAQRDKDAIWRCYVNDVLATDYPALFSSVNIWAMLQAPAFAEVYRWRLEQEEKLAQAETGQSDTDINIMTAAQVSDFIQYYQRLTEHSLRELPNKVHHLYQLDLKRRIQAYTAPLLSSPSPL